MFCLLPQLAEKLKSALRSGKLNPEKLNDMTSAERRNILSEIIGEKDAIAVNLLFEKKLLLKNQERAMYEWAKEIVGLSKDAKEATVAKIKQAFEDRQRRLYDPRENENFLNEITSDVYSKKYGTEVSLEEAQTLTELGQDVKSALEMATKDENGKITFGNKIDRFNYGASKVAFDNYAEKLKLNALKEDLINPLKQKEFGDKVSALYKDARIATNFIASNSRSLVSSIDNSFFGRQGLKVLFDPKYSKIWYKNFIQSFKDIARTLKGQDVMDAVRAEIISRDNSINGLYQNKGGSRLDTAGIEEAYPTSAPSKMPIIGRLFKASEVAYEAGAMRMRADIADMLYKQAQEAGFDLKSNRVELSNINEMVNSITGRGKLKLSEGQQAAVNKAFFSIKFLKSNLDFLAAPARYLADTKSFARKQAAMNTLRVAATIGTTLWIADQLIPGSVEWDSRSSNFGKIKIGNTRFDITGGASSLVTLATRLARKSTKSSITGKITKLGEGYGAPDGMDVLWNFTENKFSPLFTTIKDIVNGKDFMGKRITAGSLIQNLTTPMLVQTMLEAKDNENSANLMLVLIADALGISTNTYSQQFNWETSTSSELKAFKEKIGTEKFKQANEEFNSQYNNWYSGVVKNSKYNSLTDERKDSVLSAKKEKLKDNIFRKYGFRYKKAKAQPININQYK